MMIHHISIPASNPLHVAQVLAEVFDGKVGIFPPNPDSYMVVAGDEYGTLIEIYPSDSVIVPGQGDGQAWFQKDAHAASYSAVHAAISVPTNLEQIERIAAREGWRVLPCSRDGLFDVIEFWVENQLMLELLTPALAHKYLNAMHPNNLEQLMLDIAQVEARA
ncbi:hypothetical protein [Leptolyngbya sp. FACHB-711]|uniref:hypothetical protein n=1 Tax=unclassified Leptolyngbya TaxID=2650499 RepID=UPI001F54BE2D|nr:hypothetical protein [Leptolyngbya sp. FACHB-711]